MSAPHCRLCGAELRDTFVDLGMSPPCESYLTRRPARQRRDVLPAARADLRRVPAGPAAGVHRRARTSSADYAYFSSYSDSWVAHAERFVRARRRPARPGRRTRSSSRWPATTATCCSTSSRRGIRCLGIEPAANIAEVARREGHPDRGRCSSARRPGTDVAGRARPGRPGRRPTTCSPTCPTSSTSPRACARWWPTTGTVTHRDPAPAAADRGQRVRHDLPRALLLPLPADRPSGCWPTAGLTVVDVEELPTPRRLAAHLVDADRAAPASRPTPVARVLAAEAAAGLHTLEGHAGFAERGRDGAQRPRRVPHRLLARRARRSSRYGAPGKGNTLLNHCGIRDRPARVHRRPQPVQARACSCRARTSRSIPSERLAEDAARLRR